MPPVPNRVAGGKKLDAKVFLFCAESITKDKDPVLVLECGLSCGSRGWFDKKAALHQSARCATQSLPLSLGRIIRHHLQLPLNQTPGEVEELAPTAARSGAVIDGVTLITPAGTLTPTPDLLPVLALIGRCLWLMLIHAAPALTLSCRPPAPPLGFGDI